MAGHGKHPILDSNPGIKIAGKGKGKKSKIGNQARNDTGTVERLKCNLCGGPHRTLISCPKLPQYIPYGNNQVQPHASLCLKCLGTGYQNAIQCKHGTHDRWKKFICPTSNKNFILCECSKHIPALEFLSKLHTPALGFMNLAIMKKMFGADVYRAMCSTVSESDFNTLPAVPVSMSLRGSTVSKVDKGVQAVLDKSSHKEATWKEVEEGHQVVRLTLDIGCIITLGVICVFLTGFMWYHVEFKDYQFPSWLTDKN